MSYSTLDDARDFARAHRAIAAAIREVGARRSKVRLQEGVLVGLYVPDEDLWFATHRLANRYRNAFGVGDPHDQRGVIWPSVQLNVPLAPDSSRTHARFVTDRRGELWIAHSGTLGGRQAGISRAGFLRSMGGGRSIAIDGKHETVILLGAVGKAAALVRNIARLTHTAAAFRAALAAGLT